MRHAVVALATMQFLAAPTLWSQSASAPPAPLSLASRLADAQPRIRTQLRDSYRVRLVSDWPQFTMPGSACSNGGQETLTGTLSRTGSGYAGQLERSATIQFCGAHGALSPAPCTLTLHSRGPVLANAAVVMEGSRPVVLLRWTAHRGSPAELSVQGTCDPVFNQSLKDLYLGVVRAVEFPLPAEGEYGLPVRLDDYGWIVAVW